jgi:hypothetical protein
VRRARGHCAVGYLIDRRTLTDNDLVKRLAWSALLAGFGAIATMVTARVAAVAYRRIFGEDPPE